MRMIIYRRFMLKIAAEIARSCGAGFLSCGDSLSQVASQTFANLQVTYRDVDFPILTPTIGMDKNEIVRLAKQIGTYDISQLPYGDCCSFFVSKHPMLNARIETVKDIETNFEIPPMLKKALESSKILNW